MDDEKKKRVNRIIIIVSVAAVLCVAAIVLIPGLHGVENAVMQDESKLSNTYNASRYFFRFGYPDDWMVVTDINGQGFMKDKDKGIVVTLYPKAENKEDTATATANATVSGASSGTPAQTTAQNGNVTTVLPADMPVKINVFYKGNARDKKLSQKDACFQFLDRLTAGLKYDGTDNFPIYEFGGITEERMDNLTFLKASYSCRVYAKSDIETDGSGMKAARENASPVYVTNGELYVASRSMAYYAVDFEADASISTSKYNEYRRDLLNILNDFRFSVFED